MATNDNEPRDLEIADVRRDIAELSRDLQANMKELVGISDVGDLVKHMKNTLWPTLEATIDRLGELADIVDVNEEAMIEMASEESDVLTQETGTKIAQALVIGSAIAAALEARITPADGPEIAEHVADYKKLAEELLETVNDITIVTADNEEEDDDDE